MSARMASPVRSSGRIFRASDSTAFTVQRYHEAPRGHRRWRQTIETPGDWQAPRLASQPLTRNLIGLTERGARRARLEDHITSPFGYLAPMSVGSPHDGQCEPLRALTTACDAPHSSYLSKERGPMLRRCRPILSLVVFVFGAPALFGCGGTIEADPPGLGTLAPPDSAPLPTEPPAASPGSVQPSAPRPAVERGRTLFDLGIVTPLCMTRTGQHFLYLRRDGTGSAELRHLDLARSVDTTVVRRAEAILLAPRAYLETRFGADDLTDSERRTRCATDALGAHAVVHLVAGELLRVSLDTDTTERFTYDTERGDLRTLSISADARAILYSQGVVALGGRGARYLDTLTGKTIGVDEHFSAPPEIPGHCVFHPYTGIHYPAGAFHCENNINGGPTYVLQGGLFTPVPIRANRLGTTFFFAGGDEAKSIDLRTGAATPLPSMWIGARNSLPRVVSESPLRALWVPPFDPFASPSAEIATPSGLVPLPPSGWVQVAGPTSALGYRNGASNGTIVSWSYGASPPPYDTSAAGAPPSPSRRHHLPLSRRERPLDHSRLGVLHAVWRRVLARDVALAHLGRSGKGRSQRHESIRPSHGEARRRHVHDLHLAGDAASRWHSRCAPPPTPPLHHRDPYHDALQLGRHAPGRHTRRREGPHRRRRGLPPIDGPRDTQLRGPRSARQGAPWTRPLYPAARE